MTHIKTPWRHDDEFRAINIFDVENRNIATLNCGYGDYVENDDGSKSCEGLSHNEVKANAKLICKAVNSHEALVSALKDIMHFVKNLETEERFDYSMVIGELALKLAEGDE